MRSQFLMVVALVAAFCVRRPQGIPNGIASVPEMKNRVAALVPLGASAADAAARMSTAGFICTVYKQQPFGRPSEKLDYLYCARSEGLVVQRRWQIALVLQHSRVA